jgi:hypothetical protein
MGQPQDHRKRPGSVVPRLFQTSPPPFVTIGIPHENHGVRPRLYEKQESLVRFVGVEIARLAAK